MNITDFANIVVVDFEFSQYEGDLPSIHCGVFHELNSGRMLKLWCDNFGRDPPFPVNRSTLWVAYYCPAELSCFEVLNWVSPWYLCDLYAEYRVLTNGHPIFSQKRSLIDALQWANLDPLEAAFKESMRDLAIRGGPYSARERADLLEYCAGAVRATGGLFRKMVPR